MKQGRGFTLLEMLASLGLLSVLMLLIGSSLLSTRRSIQSASAYSERLDEFAAAQLFLRQALESRIPVRLEGTTVFEGGAEHMRFVAPLPMGLGGQLKINEIDTQTVQGAVALQVAFYSRDSGAPWGGLQILALRLESVRFSYFGRDERLNPTGWLQTWPWPDRWPEAIRVEAAAQGPVQWPTFTVRLAGLPAGVQ